MVVWLAVFVAQDDGGGSLVGVRADGDEYRYRLNENRTIDFDGPLGTTRVRVADGDVQVLSDPGPRQICVRQGAISQPGQWLACLPNKVFIRIYGDTGKARVDAESY